MINIEDLKITGNEVLTAQKWNALLDETKRFLSGNVGLGTDTPQAKLEIKGGGPSNNIDLLISGRIKSTSMEGGLWIGDERFVGGFENKIGFWNKTAYHLVVQNNGNVGIGTYNPVAKLDVRGSLTAYSGSNFNAVSYSLGREVLEGDIAIASGTGTYNTNTYAGDLVIRNRNPNNKIAFSIGPNTSPMLFIYKTGATFAGLCFATAFYTQSTRKDKRNISTFNDDFGKILQLEPRKYTRPSDATSWEIGYIAEEAKSLGLEHLIKLDENNFPLGIDYTRLSLYIIEVLRDHESKLNPKSPYLQKYVEKEVPRPDAKSDLKAIKDYLDYYSTAYDANDNKDALLKKVQDLHGQDDIKK